MKIDLDNEILQKHINSFHGLEDKPPFSISDDSDVHILFTKRKDKYYRIRTAEKLNFKSRAEFLVNSVLIEKIRVHSKHKLMLRDLNAEVYGLTELTGLLSRARNIEKHLPQIDQIEFAKTIVNDSESNWVFLEDKEKYHSLFWADSESKYFGRSE